MPAAKTYFWSNTPFLRLLLPLVSGILLQWNFSLPVFFLFEIFSVSIVLVLGYFLLPVVEKYRFSWLNGLAINLLLATVGALLVWKNDIRNHKQWLGRFYSPDAAVVAVLAEPPVEKSNSFKALAEVKAIYKNQSIYPAEGKIIIYFKKASSLQNLTYGSPIVFQKPLQEIKNSGNPGGFDYKGYNLFQGITHQVYVTETEFKLLPPTQTSLWNAFILRGRTATVSLLKKYIRTPKEQGFAEALLIGYKDDLDKNLVQSYSNTGVVHIIAISGLHLGMIYSLLLWLTHMFKRRLRWIRFLLIVGGLWLFTFMAGAQPSVLRASVMFSCLAFSEVLGRRSFMYNTLALSAFILLCWNPFWLWNVGFQLSYAAVLSILIFFKPIYSGLYFPNKAIDFFWKLTSVTLAAQIFTLPVSMYHFHQVPVVFLLTNLLVVPIAGLILTGELLLCFLSFIHPLATFLGGLLQGCIYGLNCYVERLDNVSFAVWNGFSVSILQTVLLLGFIAGAAYWLLEERKKALWFALVCLVLFTAFRSISFMTAYRQQKLIVYNVPKHQAIDIIRGREYFFMGDSILLYDGFLRNFHLQPSRILNRISPAGTSTAKTFDFAEKRIMVLDAEMHFLPQSQKQPLDVLILSKNPKCYLNEVAQAFAVKQVVIDGSVPAWKSRLWKTDCALLRWPCFDVSEKGAFVMTVQ